MKYFFLIIATPFILQPYLAYSVDKTMQYDSVSIGHIPSKGAYVIDEPPIIAETKSIPQHKNVERERERASFIELNIELKNPTSDERSDNAAQFHEPIQHIETIYHVIDRSR